MKQTVKDL